MMAQTRLCRYASRPALDVLELPYAGGDLSMVVLLPTELDGLPALESGMTADSVEKWLGDLAEEEVRVALPRFKTTSTVDLSETLLAMGMVDAFGPRADFSGMDGRSGWLYIGAVLHKAFVEVNEEGTEAAASTVVRVQALSLPSRTITFRADHPFVFLIRENQTGSILFLGRMTDPSVES
jgi:serpin B